MYIEHSKIRQTTEPEHRTQFSARGEKAVESQAHLSDYYNISDLKQMKQNKGQKALKKKSKNKKSKGKKNMASFSVGSAQSHSTSIQKLQLAVGSKNKQKVSLMVETQKLKNENNLMLLQILTPRDKKQAEYIKQLEQKDQKIKQLDLAREEGMRKMENKISKLEKQKKKLEKELEKLEETQWMRR